jgi:undecaprenyl diphosphate synthase|tara:strand:- start:53 stop:805 length:753 start_codon:yes stop_codon:yes gene_type:complete
VPERKGSDNPAAPSTTADTPVHVAIIMDGNGRWAEDRGLSRLEGHRAGTQNIRTIAQSAAKSGVKYLTLFAFSTENWSRSDNEVTGLMDILGEVIEGEAEEMSDAGVRLNHLGRIDRLPPPLQEAITAAMALTQDNTGLVLSVAFDYGGRDEILHAVKRIIADGVPPEQLDEATLNRYLYTDGIPDPDLIVRTGGEMRLSNFLLWQAAYSEHFVTDVRWPDFDEGEFLKALDVYRNRQRRFGGLRPSEAG